MKKIVIVEDRPWVTEEAVKKIQEENIEIVAMVFYPNLNSPKQKQEQLIEKFKKNTGVDVKTVSSQREFEEVMDILYQKEENVFLMDFDLKGDGSTNFDNRINVRYVKKREREEHENKRFWIYTTGNVDVKNILAVQFKNHVIDADFWEMQVEWDMDQIRQIVEA